MAFENMFYFSDKLRADGKVDVVNANRDGKPNGPIKNITGYAYVPDEKDPGKLKVDLAGVPFEGNCESFSLHAATLSCREKQALFSGETLYLVTR